MKENNEKLANKINLDSYLIKISQMVIAGILGVTLFTVFVVLSVEYSLKKVITAPIYMFVFLMKLAFAPMKICCD